MSALGPWFKCYPDRALKGTQDFAPDVSGIYLKLIFMMYEAGDAIRLDDRTLARRLNTNARKLDRVRAELVALGKLHFLADGGLIEELALTEMLETCQQRSDQIPHHVSERLAKLWNMFCESSGKDLQNFSKTLPKNTTKTKPPIRGKKIEERYISSSLRSDDSDHASDQSSDPDFFQMRNDWKPSSDEYALATELNLTEKEVEDVRQEFVCYWTETAGATGARKSERGWNSAFRERLRRAASRWGASKRGGFNSGAYGGGAKSAADFAREFSTQVRQAQSADGIAERRGREKGGSDVGNLRRVGGGSY